MRNEVKDKVDEIAKKYMTQGGTQVSSDHNGGKLRIAIDFNDAIEEETRQVEAELTKVYPGATIYTFNK